MAAGFPGPGDRRGRGIPNFKVKSLAACLPVTCIHYRDHRTGSGFTASH